MIGNYENKPIVLDDTCYFLSFDTEDEANKICSLLNSTAAQEFFKSFIFWDAKRPITVDVLQKLDIAKLEKYGETKARDGQDKAFEELKNDREETMIGVDVQNSFDFEVWK